METRVSAERQETARVEAFSDGVFAIAITLLALELRVPHGTPGEALGRELLRLWPSYAAFLTSFTTIGIMWLSHHRLFSLIRRVDHRLLKLNALLLLGVTAVSFPTSLVASYLGHPGDRVAAMVYSGTFIALALAFNLLWRHIANTRHPRRLLDVPDDDPDVRNITASYRWGPLMYVATFALAFWNATASVALVLAFAVFWLIQSRPVHERAKPKS